MRRLAIALALVVGLGAQHSATAATITVVNGDGAGEGFNDATVVSAVGGNPGTTLGAQRLNAFTHAAGLWGAQLTSAVTIRVNATMDVLTCSSTSATLGSAGANTVHYDFTNAPYGNTYYPQALANKIAGLDLSGINDITAYFNSAIGTTCDFPRTWYYGLDGNPGALQLDFVTVVLHEIGHGLGFQTYVSLASGQRFNNRDDVYMKFLEDHSAALAWSAMNDGQRAASAVDTSDLHWTGSAVVAAGASLAAGRHASGHVQMYAPGALVGGSSVSHWDTALSPDELMEPSYTTDMTDPSLARDLMTDLGWDFVSTTTTTTTSTTTSSTTITTTSTTSTISSTITTSTTSTTTSSTTTTTSSTTTSSTTTTSTSTTTTSTSTTSTTSTTTTTSSTTTSTSTTTTSTSTTTSTTVPVACAGTLDTFTNPATTPLADAGVTESTIVVSGVGAYLLRLEATTVLAHSRSGDLDVTLTSPAGTVVTLTSDNGDTAANVFDGTTWSDTANPGGDVPYESNDGMATDTDYVSGDVQPSLTPEKALGAFRGENPNGTWTLRVSDDAAGHSGTLDGWSLGVTALPDAVPSDVASFTNATPVAVPSGPAVVSSTVVVSGVRSFLLDLDVYTVLPHTYSDDLDVTLTSPAGTVVALTSDNAPGVTDAFAGTLWDDGADPTGQVPYASNARLVTDRTWAPSGAATPLVPEEPLAAFLGEDPNGTWTLTISDDAADDAGTLTQWRLDVRTGVCQAPGATSTSTTTTSTSSTISTTTATSTTTVAPTTSTTTPATTSTTSLAPATTTTSTSTPVTTTVPTTTATTSTSTSTTGSTTTVTTSTSTTSTASTSTSTTSSSSTTSATSSSSTTTTTTATSTTSSTVSTTTATTTSTATTSTATTSSTTTLPEQTELCPSEPLASCRAGASQRSKVLLRNGAPDAKDLLKWKIAQGGHATPADLGDPAGSALEVGICLYDASTRLQPLLASLVPAPGQCGGKPCWKALAGGGYRYKNRTGTPGGVVDLKVQISGLGELTLVAKGKGAALAMPALALTTPVRLQLVVRGEAGSACWESTFARSVKNDSVLFKANGS